MKADVLPSGTKKFERASAVLAARFAVEAKRKNQRFIFMTPPPIGRLPCIIAAGLLLADFSHNIGFVVPQDESGSLLDGDLLVATHAVSETIDLLRSLRLGGQKLEEKWLVDSYSRYKPLLGTGPRVYVTNSGWILDGLPPGRISGVVIDSSHPRTLLRLSRILQKLEGIRIQIIITLPMLENELSDLGYPNKSNVWLWDPEAKRALEECISGTSPPALPLVKRSIWVCSYPELNQTLSKVHEILALMQKKAGKTPPLVWEAWSIYHRLRQLTVPLAQLEDATYSTWGSMLLIKRLERLREETPEAVELRAPWPDFIEHLQKSYKILLDLKEPPKFWALAERVQDYLKKSRAPFRIVVPTEREGTILNINLNYLIDDWLSAQREERAEVIWAKEEARRVSTGNMKSTLLAGFRVGLQRHFDLFPEYNTEVIAYPYEAEIDIAHQNRIFDFAETLQEEAKRADLLSTLHLPSGDASSGPKTPRPKLEIVGVIESVCTPVRSFLYDPTTMDLERLSGTGLPQGWDEDPVIEPPETAEVEKKRGIVVYVTFEGGRVLKYAPWQLVDIYHPASQRIQRFRAKELRPGMKVILLVDSIYEGLFERLIEALKARANHYSLIILGLWEKAKTELLKKHQGNRMELFEHVAAKGLSVGYQAVNLLFADNISLQMRLGFAEESDAIGSETIAPQLYSDMRILAEYSGLFPNESMIKFTFKAIQEERGRRRKAGHALHNWLRAIISGKDFDRAMISAQELGSEVAEVLNTLDIRGVCDVRIADFSKNDGN